MISDCFDFRGDIYPEKKDVHTRKGIETIIVPALKSDPAKNVTLIFIHGLGSSGNQVHSIVDRWRKEFPYMKCIYPSADKMPLTMNYGMELPAWFDVLELGTRVFPTNGWAGMLHSVRRVREIMLKEIESGTPPERIIFAGFSQGAAMCFATVFNTCVKVGAIVSLSGFYYIPILEQASEHIITNVNKSTPVLVAHGEKDSMILVEAAHCTRDAFQLHSNAETNFNFRLYPDMEHTVTEEVHRDVIEFLKNSVPAMSDDRNVKYSDSELEQMKENCVTSVNYAREFATRYPKVTHSEVSQGMMKGFKKKIQYLESSVEPSTQAEEVVQTAGNRVKTHRKIKSEAKSRTIPRSYQIETQTHEETNEHWDADDERSDENDEVRDSCHQRVVKIVFDFTSNLYTFVGKKSMKIARLTPLAFFLPDPPKETKKKRSRR